MATDQLNVSERAREAAESLWYGMTARLLKQIEAQGSSVNFAPFDRNGNIVQAFASFEQPLADRVRELEAALNDTASMLDWAARAMKGHCSGGDVNAVMLAAGRATAARAALNRSTTDAAE